MRRNCCEVVLNMLKFVPFDRMEFVQDLNWNYSDASYKPLEENLQWQRLSKTINKHISIPTQDWEFELLSEFTTKSITELKQMVNHE